MACLTCHQWRLLKLSNSNDNFENELVLKILIQLEIQLTKTF